MDTTSKLKKKLQSMELTETKFFVNAEFNEAFALMNEKIDKAREKGMDVSDNEQIMDRLAICWGVVNSVYEANCEYYRRLTILGATLVRTKELLEAAEKEVRQLKESLNERAATEGITQD